MPLTEIQRNILSAVAGNRTLDSYLAGGAALHFTPNSLRYSQALDFFHDSAERLATAFEDDRRTLEAADYQIDVQISQPGFVRAVIEQAGEHADRWGHDSAWRFMPPIRDELGGFLLHPVDLAINKVLALVGRDEARDFIDTLSCTRTPCDWELWCGQPPGRTRASHPGHCSSCLSGEGVTTRRTSRVLTLARPIDPVETKEEWLGAMKSAEVFVHGRPPAESGALYYDMETEEFVAPPLDVEISDSLVLHYGCPGGVLPQPVAET